MIAPSEKDTANQTLEKRLWEAADQLRANSGLTAAQYSTPVLGLIFLRFAEARFAKRRADLENPPSPARAGEGRGEGKLKFRDVPGLCRAATLNEIEAQGWSLNPGRYVGVAPGEAVSEEDFKEQLEELNEELEILNTQARELEQTVARNVAEILET
jgi:type I restriction-modification system DNA methylase subunit